MAPPSRSNASIQSFFPPTPGTSPTKPSQASSSPAPIGDGFTATEVRAALEHPEPEPWQPQVEYAECEIRDLYPGPRAVTFMGRVANIFDIVNAPKTPRSAKGCVKLCVKDGGGAVTVRVWYANRYPNVRLGSLVSVWTNHAQVSNGESGNLATGTAPLFASLFPERDRSCHLMIHTNSDPGVMFRKPLGYRSGRQLEGLMTLQSFNDGGYDVVDPKILVVVKSIGAKKKITRKDGSTTENVNLQVHDDTAEATLGLWGTSAYSPGGGILSNAEPSETAEMIPARQPWKAGETVLLLQGPGWKIGRTTYLTLTSTTIVDVDPDMKDTDWLRRWAVQQKSREAINPPFPEGVFDPAETAGPNSSRCLFTIAELDEFARAAPTETFQGYMSVLIVEVRLLETWKRQMLFSGECCNIPLYANATSALCKGCDKETALRLNPRILGQIVDETAVVAPGKLLLSAKAWEELLGRKPADLLKLNDDQMKDLAERLLFCRITLVFGWTGDQSKAGGRICALSVMR